MNYKMRRVFNTISDTKMVKPDKLITMLKSCLNSTITP